MTVRPNMTRRDLFHLLSATVLSATIPPCAGLSQQSRGSVIEELSAYMSDARNRALPAEVLEKAKHHILDTFAAMISGSELPPGKAAIQFARAYGGPRVSTIVGSNILCGPIEAAMASRLLRLTGVEAAAEPSHEK